MDTTTTAPLSFAGPVIAGSSAGLTRGARAVDAAGTAGTVAVAAASLAMSWHALTALAVENGINGPLQYALPIGLDGLQLTGSTLTLAYVQSGRRTWLPWTVIITATGLSSYLNYVMAPENIPGRLIYSVMPWILALAFHLLMQQVKHRLDGRVSAKTAPVKAEPVEAATVPAPVKEGLPPMPPRVPATPPVTPPVAEPVTEPVRAVRTLRSTPGTPVNARAKEIITALVRDGAEFTSTTVLDRLKREGYADVPSDGAIRKWKRGAEAA